MCQKALKDNQKSLKEKAFISLALVLIFYIF